MFIKFPWLLLRVSRSRRYRRSARFLPEEKATDCAEFQLVPVKKGVQDPYPGIRGRKIAVSPVRGRKLSIKPARGRKIR